MIFSVVSLFEGLVRKFVKDSTNCRIFWKFFLEKVVEGISAGEAHTFHVAA